MTRTQVWTGGLAIVGIIVFLVIGTVQYVQAESFRYVRDSTYLEECGACHLAFPPQLLPESSWSQVMAGLEDHFGEPADLDQETSDHILAYLHKYSLGKNPPSAMSKMARNLPADAGLRITELPAFLDAHEPLLEQYEMESFPTGFLTPCADCHRQAASALFDKELLHPGYGPSIWGGTPVEE